jgi:hypothetical protein
MESLPIHAPLRTDLVASNSLLSSSQICPRSESSNTPTAISSASPVDRRTNSEEMFLEICINVTQYTNTLCEVNLTNIRSDEELFAKIREEYFRIRKRRSTLWLLKPSGVHFVKASLKLPGKLEERD